MQENYHSGMSFFHYLILRDKEMTSDSKMDWHYYLFYLMIIDAFCEMLSHFYCDRDRVPTLRYSCIGGCLVAQKPHLKAK